MMKTIVKRIVELMIRMWLPGYHLSKNPVRKPKLEGERDGR
jgi:hypothetical protein